MDMLALVKLHRSIDLGVLQNIVAWVCFKIPKPWISC